MSSDPETYRIIMGTHYSQYEPFVIEESRAREKPGVIYFNDTRYTRRSQAKADLYAMKIRMGANIPRQDLLEIAMLLDEIVGRKDSNVE